ncbi:segregation and condensation protein A [Rhodothermus profundi]|uniref:Segregation and condensation protein A n=1 Tax=Rhodothermus profundi TaxID=633813 RepID=A0A1M6SK41_9BACT|nr:segregation/condensation protein A [Rhodothermus profundi]SHK45111.1 condensin subunit ScpA [Rhodothermus profundi]
MYRVRLPVFEGPLDLLLYFIRRDELDIYDIPVARIADEFLAYVRLMEELDLDGVGDFLYLAAVLLHIKAQMLLPRPSQEVEEEPAAADPRQELVERLLNYLRYKEAAARLEAHAEHRRQCYRRGEAARGVDEQQVVGPPPLAPIPFPELLGALQRVLQRWAAPPAHTVRRETYSVEAQMRYVQELLRDRAACSFSALVAGRPRGFVIATFLAVLELARQGQVWLRLLDGDEDFLVAACEEPSVEEADVAA